MVRCEVPSAFKGRCFRSMLTGPYVWWISVDVGDPSGDGEEQTLTGHICEDRGGVDEIKRRRGGL